MAFAPLSAGAAAAMMIAFLSPAAPDAPTALEAGLAPPASVEPAKATAQVRLAQAPATSAAPDAASDAPPPVDGPVAFAGASDEDVVELVSTYLASLTTMQADFLQVAPSGAMSDGRLWLRRPRQLRMEYGASDDPQLLIVATQGNVYVRDNDLDTTDFYPIERTPLRFILGEPLDLDELEVVAVGREADRVDVTFRDPKQEAEGELTLVFDAPTLRLREWAVLDPQGGVTVVALDQIEEGGNVANRLFRVPDAGGEFLNR